MSSLLIVYHSQSGKTQTMADAVHSGACEVDDVNVHFKRAFDAGVDDLLACNALILGTPENFGYMSGALKDFFDRTFYPAEGKLNNLPYGVFIGAGNDGTGALTSIEKIARGYPLRRVAEPVIVCGELTDADQTRLRELGQTFAAGLSLGIY